MKDARSIDKQRSSVPTAVLAVLFVALTGARADQTVIVRSGNGTVGSQDTEVRFLSYGVTSDVTPQPADFVTVKTGPFAYVVPPDGPYIPQLPSDPNAKWIAHSPGLASGSALYAVPFQLTDSVITSATLTFYFSVDNAVNGIFFNGQRISGNSYDGDYHAQYEFVRNDIGPLLIPNSTNWLYVNASDYGAASAIDFQRHDYHHGRVQQHFAKCRWKRW
jgi:hypothetical protein